MKKPTHPRAADSAQTAEQAELVRANLDACVDIDEGRMAAEACDHDWHFLDESFDHEFGCEQVHSFECRKCGAIRPATDKDRAGDPDML
jgi:hypothetical protein